MADDALIDLAVGDLVMVVQPSGVNGPYARAVVVERYELAERPGWTLLFEDGRFNGFSPLDCETFNVVRLGHLCALETYRFRSATHLTRDWRAGVFAAAWPKANQRSEP